MIIQPKAMLTFTDFAMLDSIWDFLLRGFHCVSKEFNYSSFYKFIIADFERRSYDRQTYRSCQTVWFARLKWPFARLIPVHIDFTLSSLTHPLLNSSKIKKLDRLLMYRIKYESSRRNCWKSWSGRTRCKYASNDWDACLSYDTARYETRDWY